MRTILKHNKVYAPLSELHVWKDNPREIKEKDFEELKSSYQKYGQLSPLLVRSKDGMVIGGNNSLRAFTDLKWTEAWVDIVDIRQKKNGKWEVANVLFDDDVYVIGVGEYETELQAIVELAVIHNAHYATWNDQSLAELALKVGSSIDLEQLRVNIGKHNSLQEIVEHFAPDKLPKIETDEDPFDHDMQTYLHGTIKQIVLYYNNDDYLVRFEQFARLRKHLGFEDNSAVVNKLIDDFMAANEVPELEGGNG